VGQPAEGGEVRAAVGVDHALGTAGGARRVVDRNRLPLVVDRPVESAGLRLIEQHAVVHGAGNHACRRFFGVDDRDDGPHRRERPEQGRDEVRERRVDHEDDGLGVVADVADLLGGQPGIDGDEHRARQRHREVRDHHLGHVGQQARHAVARGHARRAERGGQPLRLVGEFTVGEAAGAVDDGGLAGVDLCAATEEGKRSQLGVHKTHCR
jgi:hypothetical protein